LWIDGELIGGCDIITEMHESGELKTMIDECAAKMGE
jgi:monothiol glutaredoxin